MNNKTRFKAIMNYEEFDRVPVWYFGIWKATRERWLKEGLPEDANVAEFCGMDPDWMRYKGIAGQLITLGTITDKEPEILEETETYKIVKHGNGGVNHVSKEYADAMSHTVEWALKPTRESWNEFKKFLQPDMPGRFKDNWEEKAKDLNSNKEDVICASVGGLYRMPEFWLGIEELSYLPYDDPSLFEEILDTLTTLYITTYTPVVEKVKFDLAYVFEDCCGSSGPLVSPTIYDQFYKKYYRKITDFFHSHGTKVMMDSDGCIDDMIPCWMDSGMDIVFPIEVGKWKASPLEFRKKYGRELQLFGGFNKHAIAKGEKAIRAELEPMVPLVKEGGFIPIPDHKISPECSLQNFIDYVRIFKEIFS